jgi:hypothetical protein
MWQIAWLVRTTRLAFDESMFPAKSKGRQEPVKANCFSKSSCSRQSGFFTLKLEAANLQPRKHVPKQ